MGKVELLLFLFPSDRPPWLTVWVKSSNCVQWIKKVDNSNPLDWREHINSKSG